MVAAEAINIETKYFSLLISISRRYSHLPGVKAGAGEGNTALFEAAKGATDGEHEVEDDVSTNKLTTTDR